MICDYFSAFLSGERPVATLKNAVRKLMNPRKRVGGVELNLDLDKQRTADGCSGRKFSKNGVI